MSRVHCRMFARPLHAGRFHEMRRRKLLCSLQRQPVAGINGTYGTAWAHALTRLYKRQQALRLRMGHQNGIAVFSASGKTHVATLTKGAWHFHPSHWEAGCIPPTVLGDVAQHARRHDPDARQAPLGHVAAEAFRAFLRSLRGERSDNDYPRTLLRILRA